MPLPIPDPGSFITALVDKIHILTRPSSPNQNHHDSSRSSSHARKPVRDMSTSPASPPAPQSFPTLLSALPKESQESITRLLTTLHFFFPHELIPALDLLDRGLVTRFVCRPLSTTTATSRRADTDLDIEYQHSPHRPSTGMPQKPYSLITGSEDDPDLGATPKTRTQTVTETNHRTENEVFYVQSASSQIQTNTTRRRRRHHSNNTSTTYEVRLASWNCTCPAFAFSAFGQSLNLNPGDDGEEGADENHEDESRRYINTANSTAGGNPRWRFGGLLTSTPSRTRSESRSETGTPAPQMPMPVCKHILAALLGRHVPGLFGSGVQLRSVGAEEGAGWAGGWGDGD